MILLSCGFFTSVTRVCLSSFLVLCPAHIINPNKCQHRCTVPSLSNRSLSSSRSVFGIFDCLELLADDPELSKGLTSFRRHRTLPLWSVTARAGIEDYSEMSGHKAGPWLFTTLVACANTVLTSPIWRNWRLSAKHYFTVAFSSMQLDTDRTRSTWSEFYARFSSP